MNSNKISKYLSIIKNHIIEFIEKIYNKMFGFFSKNNEYKYRHLNESLNLTESESLNLTQSQNRYYDSIYDDESIPIRLYTRDSDDEYNLEQTIPDIEDFGKLKGFGDLRGDFGIIRKSSSDNSDKSDNSYDENGIQNIS